MNWNSTCRNSIPEWLQPHFPTQLCFFSSSHEHKYKCHIQSTIFVTEVHAFSFKCTLIFTILITYFCINCRPRPITRTFLYTPQSMQDVNNIIVPCSTPVWKHLHLGFSSHLFSFFPPLICHLAWSQKDLPSILLWPDVSERTVVNVINWENKKKYIYICTRVNNGYTCEEQV